MSQLQAISKLYHDNSIDAMKDIGVLWYYGYRCFIVFLGYFLRPELYLEFKFSTGASQEQSIFPGYCFPFSGILFKSFHLQLKVRLMLYFSQTQTRSKPIRCASAQLQLKWDLNSSPPQASIYLDRRTF